MKKARAARVLKNTRDLTSFTKSFINGYLLQVKVYVESRGKSNEFLFYILIYSWLISQLDIQNLEIMGKIGNHTPHKKRR